MCHAQGRPRERMSACSHLGLQKTLTDSKPLKDGLAQVGPPYVMAREDLEVVAPAWSAFTRAVRNDPDAWNLTGDASIKTPVSKSYMRPLYKPPYSSPAWIRPYIAQRQPPLQHGPAVPTLAPMQLSSSICPSVAG